MAEGTLNRSAEVLQTITPISKKVEKWANSMRNNEYSTEAYKEAVSSAGEAGIMSCVAKGSKWVPSYENFFLLFQHHL